MRILSIETSCDETALSVVSVDKKGVFAVEANLVASQAKLHEQYGGVFPMMAKREHAKALIPLFEKVLKKSKLFVKIKKGSPVLSQSQISRLKSALVREPDLLEQFLQFIPTIQKPSIDLIAVTIGPGLEPALWVGINFAQALAKLWNIPVVPVNHMEGHILSVFPTKKAKSFKIQNLKFPILSLLVSGGHTELVLMKKWGSYKILGQTRDDAAGEAFDKVARMLELPYPGGPQISKLAEIERKVKTKSPKSDIVLPRPMIHSKDYDFSFSGLKTAVLYLLRDLKKSNPAILQNKSIKNEISREFEDAVVDVLVAKTCKAIEHYKIKTLIVGGGVAANKELRHQLVISNSKLKIALLFPRSDMTGDNSLMIAIAGYMQYKRKKTVSKTLKAQGNLSLL